MKTTEGGVRRPDEVRTVLLIGFMGAGKSSVGRALGGLLGWEFEDLDDLIERREGRTVGQIFRDAGEAGFRRAEHAALQELIDGLRPEQEKVVGLGGGAFVQAENLELIVASEVSTVFLDAQVTELWHRCCLQAEKLGTDRPLLLDLAKFRELYESRKPLYAKASLRCDTDGKTVHEIAAELAKKLGFTEGRKTRGDQF